MRAIRRNLIPLLFALGMGAAMSVALPGTSRGEENPDLVLHFGCINEAVILNLGHVWDTKGEGPFAAVASEYLREAECFELSPGYPVYIMRIVKKLETQVEGEGAYVVEGRFYGDPSRKKVYFMYYGEVPARAHRSST